MRIACVGGGPAGLYFALLMKLHDPGNDITVFERKSLDSAYGWGVTFGDDIMGTLYGGDPTSAREIEQAASRWVSQVVEIPGKPPVTASHCGYSINRQRLLSIFAGRAQDLGVHLKLGHEVTALSQLPEADLVVAADGASSQIRLEAGFQTDVRLGQNKYAWLGSDKVFEPFTYAFVRTGSGWIWTYAYGVDAGSSTFIVECSAQTWAALGFDAMSTRGTLSFLEKLFERQLDGHRLVGQGHDRSDVRWSNFRTITNRSWQAGQVVLLGDAAHTTSFTIGCGTKLAIEDAVALAGKLREPGRLEPALSEYERQRKAALRQQQSDAHFSAQWFEDIPRYIDLQPRQFATLLDARRIPLLQRLPPRLSYHLVRAGDAAVLRAVRGFVAAKTKALYARRKLA